MIPGKPSQRFPGRSSALRVALALLIFMGGLVATGVATAAPASARDAVRAEDRVAHLRVDIDDPWREATDWVQLAHALIYLKEGEPFSAELLQTSLAALKLSGKFRDIAVETEPGPQGMRLIFTLVPFHLIKKFVVRDNYPLFESDIRKAMTVSVGTVYDEKRVGRQKGLIAGLYRQRGFIDPVVQIDAVQDETDGNYVLHIRVEKGTHYTLNRLTFYGNHAFSQQSLQQKMKTWRKSVLSGQTGRFEPQILEADIKKLITYYRDRRYPEIEIEHSVDFQPQAKTVKVDVRVSEGPRYEVRYEGNKAFSAFSLRKENVIFSSGNRRDAGLRKTVRNLRRRYREAGFLEAEIKAVEAPASVASVATRRIIIRIDEGPQTTVASIQIQGNQAFDDKRIQKQMLTRTPGLFHQGPYVPETLDEDVFMIRALYAEHGYLDPVVAVGVEKSADENKVVVRLRIDEGVQTRVGSITFSGRVPLPEDKLRPALALKPGEPFSPTRLQAEADALSAVFSEAGYPHVNLVAGTEFNGDRTRVNIVYDVDPGRSVQMGAFFYSGNFRTRKRVIAREHGLAPGEPFSLQKILAAQKKIRDMGIFDSVQLVSLGLKDQTDTVNIIAELEEKKPYFFEVGIGYQSDRGLFGRAKGGDRNLWGLNKDFWVGGEVSEIGYRAETVLREPRFWGTQVGMDVSAFAEETQEFNQTFGTRILGAAVDFGRPLTDQLDIGLGFRFERREQFDDAGAEFSAEELDPRSILVVTPSVLYDSRNSFVRPRQGIFSELRVDFSKGIENSLDDFSKYRVDLRYYTTPHKVLTLAFMGRAGTIRPFGDNAVIPSDQLFYLGGTNDVRGYDENMLRYDDNRDPLGGQSAVVGSIEGRIDLGYDFELTTFFDTGSVMPGPDFEGDGFRSSFGMGLRYQTIIGPIGILYGWKINPRPEETPGRWHFTIGYTY